MKNNKPKFTPGPWNKDTDTNGTHVSTFGQGIICELTSNGCKPLRGAELNQAHNREANANLIAAAPDMYEALILCLNEIEIENAGREPEVMPNQVKAMKRARESLAKARGEL